MLKFFFKKTHLDFMKGWITEEVSGNLPLGDSEDEDLLGALLGKEGEAFDWLLELPIEDEEAMGHGIGRIMYY